MLRVGKTQKLYNRENEPYYEIQVFLNTLNDLKWVNNYAAVCHMTDRKHKDSEQKNNGIEIFYYFKREKYLQKFISELKKHMNYDVAS